MSKWQDMWDLLHVSKQFFLQSHSNERIMFDGAVHFQESTVLIDSETVKDIIQSFHLGCPTYAPGVPTYEHINQAKSWFYLYSLCVRASPSVYHAFYVWQSISVGRATCLSELEVCARLCLRFRPRHCLNLHLDENDNGRL